MTAIIGKRAETADDYRELVASFLQEDPALIELWERVASTNNATDHQKALVKYGREYLATRP